MDTPKFDLMNDSSSSAINQKKQQPDEENLRFQMEIPKLDLNDDSSSSAIRHEKQQPDEGKQLIQQRMEPLAHACQCFDTNCQIPSCEQIKNIVMHTKICKRQVYRGCTICKQLVVLCCQHGKHCQETKCSVPNCNNIKFKLKQQQSRRNYRRELTLRRLHPPPNLSTSCGPMFGTVCFPTVCFPTVCFPSTTPPVPSMSGLVSLPFRNSNLIPISHSLGGNPDNRSNPRDLRLHNQLPQLSLHLFGPEQNSQVVGPTRSVQIALQLQHLQPQNNEATKLALRQLMETVNDPQISEIDRQKMILQVLKSDPPLMAAFIKQRAQQQQPLVLHQQSDEMVPGSLSNNLEHLKPQNNQTSKEVLQQLMKIRKDPHISEMDRQGMILEILKSNPALMAAFIKQRAVQQKPLVLRQHSQEVGSESLPDNLGPSQTVDLTKHDEIIKLIEQLSISNNF